MARHCHEPAQLAQRKGGIVATAGETFLVPREEKIITKEGWIGGGVVEELGSLAAVMAFALITEQLFQALSGKKLGVVPEPTGIQGIIAALCSRGVVKSGQPIEIGVAVFTGGIDDIAATPADRIEKALLEVIVGDERPGRVDKITEFADLNRDLTACEHRDAAIASLTAPIVLESALGPHVDVGIADGLPELGLFEIALGIAREEALIFVEMKDRLESHDERANVGCHVRAAFQ
jgi:hypothetical protein